MAAVLAVLGAMGASASAQTLAPSWYQQSPATSPSARGNQVMAYDSGHQQVVLFGGGGVSDTWLWNGTTWSLATTATSPSARVASQMAYDPAHGQVVMFGGLLYNSNSLRLGDTWLWDGTNWTQANVTGGPTPRDGAAMVYDPVHGQIVLFGGIDQSGNSLNDTWLWNGTTWTQATPGTSPSARFGHRLAYDAATGQVLLFGGDYSGYFNDTWVWNGTNWTQQQPATSPSARYDMGMDYDGALGQIVLFGGQGSGGYLNDTWLWSGSNWTQYTAPAPIPSQREFNQDVVYDAARGQMLLFGGLNFNQPSAATNDTWEFGLPGNFGNVNVCPSGQTTPAPCSRTVSFTYNITAPVTFSAPQILTQGVAGLDYQLNRSGTSCVGFFSTGSCTVSVTFAPSAPGIRAGSIQLTGLLDNNSTVVTNTPLYGVGQGPVAAVGFGTQTTISTGSYVFSQPKGLATDAAGNLYIADTGRHNEGNRNVVKIAPNGTHTTIGSGLLYPQGIAVDGAGDLFVADNDLNQVIEIPAGCTSSSCQQVLATPQCVVGQSGLCAQLGVAVDGPGNVFISSFNSQVIEVPANGGVQTIAYNPVGSNPVGIAVDSTGNLFVADVGLKKVVEIPIGCTVSSCQIQIGTGWNQPNDVAVDAAGDVFVTDAGRQQIIEVPAGCTSASCQIILSTGIVSAALTVDAVGDVYAVNLTANAIIEINRSQAQALNFPTTVVGTSSTASVALQNVGNQPLLAETPGLLTVSGASYSNSQGPGNPVDCSATSALAPGASCNVSILFSPQSYTQPNTGTATFSDNALNASSVQQTVSLLGMGAKPSQNFYQVTVMEPGAGSGTVTDDLGAISCTETSGTSSGTCVASLPGSGVVTFTATAAGASTFQGWGGACASAGTNPMCSVVLTQASTIIANFANLNFGAYNVCQAGQTVPGPCGTSLPVTFNFPTTTTVGAIQVVTQGATGLDFSQGSGSTCVGTVIGGNSCTVNVSFAPIAPGLRMGAVQLYDSSANLVFSEPVYGVGQAPMVVFGPGAQTVLPLTGLHYNVGVAIDALKNTYVADYSAGVVVKYSPTGVQTTVPFTGLSAPIGVAVDGAGALYVVDLNLPSVVKLAPNGVQSTIGSGLSYPVGIALDGAGDIFVSDQNNNRVVRITASGLQTTVPTPGLNQPWGVAADGQGDVFIADGKNFRVIEVTPGGVLTILAASGLAQPYGVAVDAAGDVYIADAPNARVIEVPANGGVQISIATGLNYPSGLAVDAAGSVLIGDQGAGQVVRLNRSPTPSISFATTNVGSKSTDSPVSFTAQNIGNEPLTGSLALNLGASFTQNAATSCSTAFPLAPGAICGESFSFTPQSATFFSGSATFTDNTANSVPQAAQTVYLAGIGATAGVPTTVAVPNVVGQTQAAAATPLSGVGLAAGTVSTASSQTVPSGMIISQNPVAGTQVAVGSAVSLLVSSGIPLPTAPNPLSFENNYFVTGDYVAAGVSLRTNGTGTITIQSYAQSASNGVPDGADVVDAYLYWETVESTPFASSTSGTFNGYPIVGQQIGNDLANYTDGLLTGTVRAYRAPVNAYLPVGANGIRIVSGSYSVSLPSGGAALPLTEGASLVMVYRVLSPNFPLKSVVLYDGAALPTATGAQLVQGFYDAVGGANGTGKSVNLYAANGAWNNSISSVTLGKSNQYSAPLNTGSAYAAVILSTPVNNSDNDGILNAWKAGPTGTDFHAGQPGYYDVKTGTWVGLPGAKAGQKDLFVQLDYMCGALLASGACDPAKENLFPSPDASGNDPLAMVQQAFANSGVKLHLQIGNAVPEDTCTDGGASQLCQFPGQPGVIGWKNSLEFSKLYPRNLVGCLTGGDCTTRFPYGQKDSYHYVLMGHSLAIPAWNTRYKTLTSINVANGVTTVGTVDRGTGINACPSRITLAGVIGDPLLNGVYNTTGCADTKTISFLTPGVPNYTYPNAFLAEPVIGLTSGTVTSISGYSDLGGADSAVTLGLWLTAPNQDMSKKANVLAGTIFHEVGHTLGLGHGGLYFDTPGSYIPTFEGNCKPNYQSVMNYLFQLDLVGPNQTLAFSNQTLATLNENNAGAVTQLTDTLGKPATFPTSAWYVPYTAGSTATPATRHCDGTPLNGDSAYRVDASIAPIRPAWSSPQDISFTGSPLQASERGFNDLTNMDLRQVGATGGEFASLASLLSFGTSVAPLNISAGGTVTLGSGGTASLGSGGTVTLGSGGNITLGSSGTVTLGSGGTVTLGSGGNLTVPGGSTVAPGSSGTVTLGSGGTVTLGSGGTVTLGSGGTVTLGSGGTVTLGSGGTITGSGGTVVVPSSGGTYSLDSSGGTVTLGSGGTVTLGSGGIASLSSGGTVTLGSGGTVTLGSGGTVTLGSGGTVTLGSGGIVTLGSGGNVTLGGGGTVTLGSGGTVTLGSGGTVTLGSGGTVTLGSGGSNSLSSGGTVTLGSGGTATLGAGGTVTLGSGGTVTLGSGGVTLSSGGTVTLGSGGTVTLGSGGTVTLGSGGTLTPGGGGAPISVGPGIVIVGSGGTVTLGSGGTVTLGSGGTVTLGSGGTVTLGSGGTVTLGSGGTVTLGSGGVVTLGTGGGSVSLGSGSGPSLASVSNITPSSGGPLAANELTYETANSVVRPPSLPTETKSPQGVTPASVRVNWNAPAFGVVQTYTIYRSSNGAAPIVIGSVSGVNGNAPATEFTDTNPDLVSQTVVYTVTTTLVPDTAGAAPRQSVPSPPAVLKNDQTIVLGAVPSSVLITGPLTVTATAMSGGVPNGLQVVFSATGSCTIGGQSILSNVSSATVTLNNAGICTVIAAQPGSTSFNAANSVSGTTMVLPNITSQTISFAALPNAQYGGSFSLSASSSSGQPVSFTASGPCTTAGVISGVGLCSITAKAPATSTVSAASLTQSFNIYPAVLKVIANSTSMTYGQPVPALTSTYSGFVSGDLMSVVFGAPTLSTTATSTSNAGSYPITVSTGTLATTNYSFLYVTGALTVLPANQTITFTTNPPASAVFGSTFTVAAVGGASGNKVTFTSAGACSNSGALFTMTSSSGTCSVIANQAGSLNYAAAAQVTKTVTGTGPLVTVSSSNLNFGTVYAGSISAQLITLTNAGTAPAIINDPFISIVRGGNSNEFVAISLCPKPLAPGKSCTVLIGFIAGPFYTPQTATLQIMSNAPGSPQAVTMTATVINPQASFSPSSLKFGTVKHGTSSTLNVTLSNPGGTPLALNGVSITGANATSFVQNSTCAGSLAAGASCNIAVKFTPAAAATFSAVLTVSDNAQAGSGKQTVLLSGTGN